MVMFQDQCINVRGICRRLESLLKSQSDFILKIRIKRLDTRYSQVRGGSFLCVIRVNLYGSFVCSQSSTMDITMWRLKILQIEKKTFIIYTCRCKTIIFLEFHE